MRPTSKDARRSCGGIFDFEGKERRLAEVAKLAEDPAVWSDNKRAQDLGRERKNLESLVGTFHRLDTGYELYSVGRDEEDNGGDIGPDEKTATPGSVGRDIGIAMPLPAVNSSPRR